ncbi:TMEM175 family protein [Olsenella sp. Marseille-P4559]|uniref:TMEM175 family protein n=1 Tax=Olsenella sp. Marseille-P4559 TaxID=2364795 RepID=UPI0010313063|nr:TMEM175 family protein [Olsenella sp. Marseille-P4559]
MKKERLVAFTDAILAIIMTILVLALERPDEPTLSAFWALRNSYLSYALSFFWLGSLWMSLNEVWDNVKRIDNATVMWTLILLFLASLIPYTTDLVSYYFESRIVQCGYGLVVLLMTGANWMLHRTLEAPNADVAELVGASRWYRKVLGPDIAIKVSALLVSLLVWSPATMVDVLIAAAYFYVMRWRSSRQPA